MAALLVASLAVLGAPAAKRLGVGDARFDAAEAVYRAVGDAAGLLSMPALEVVEEAPGAKGSIAWYTPAGPAVGISTLGIGLCQERFGADSAACTAFLLGHELAHFSKGHGWGSDFGKFIPAKLVNLADVTNYEQQADYFGAIFAYQAGFNSAGLPQKVVAAVYQKFVGADLHGYPDLKTRQAIAGEAERKLGAMLPVFDAGIKLLVSGYYEPAARCFDFIARNGFPGREILNNAGVARLMQALALTNTAEAGFVYPAEVDAETRLSKVVMKDPKGASQRDRLLALAGDSFRRAIAADPGYFTAVVNAACVADLQGNPARAISLINGAMTEPTAGGSIARGIAFAHSNPPRMGEAEADFRAASKLGSGLGEANLRMLKKLGVAPAVPGGAEAGKGEQIGGKTADQHELGLSKTPTKIEASGAGEAPLAVHGRDYGTWSALLVSEDIDHEYQFLSTGAGYAGSMARGGVKVGSAADDVMKAYGQPSGRVRSRGGEFLVYRAAGLIIELRSNAVAGWTLANALAP